MWQGLGAPGPAWPELRLDSDQTFAVIPVGCDAESCVLRGTWDVVGVAIALHGPFEGTHLRPWEEDGFPPVVWSREQMRRQDCHPGPWPQLDRLGRVQLPSIYELCAWDLRPH